MLVIVSRHWIITLLRRMFQPLFNQGNGRQKIAEMVIFTLYTSYFTLEVFNDSYQEVFQSWDLVEHVIQGHIQILQAECIENIKVVLLKFLVSSHELMIVMLGARVLLSLLHLLLILTILLNAMLRGFVICDAWVWSSFTVRMLRIICGADLVNSLFFVQG